MLGIILSISVALLKALSEFAGKVFMTSDKQDSLDEYSLALGVRSIVIVPVFLICLFQGFNTNIFSSLFIITISGALSATATITAFKALKYGDLSIVGPLGSLTIPFMLITSYFITREVPNIYGVIGVLIIFFGTYFLGVDIQNKGIVKPIKNIFSDIGARYMFITTFIWSLTAPLDKLGTLELGTFHWLLYLNIVTVICLLAYMIITQKKIQLAEIYSYKNIKKVGAMACIMGLGNVIQLLAIKYTLVVYVAAIKRASGVFSVLLGALFFKEKNIKWKLFAVGLMVLGVLFIVLGGNI